MGWDDYQSGGRQSHAKNIALGTAALSAIAMWGCQQDADGESAEMMTVQGCSLAGSDRNAAINQLNAQFVQLATYFRTAMDRISLSYAGLSQGSRMAQLMAELESVGLAMHTYHATVIFDALRNRNYQSSTMVDIFSKSLVQLNIEYKDIETLPRSKKEELANALACNGLQTDAFAAAGLLTELQSPTVSEIIEQATVVPPGKVEVVSVSGTMQMTGLESIINDAADALPPSLSAFDSQDNKLEASKHVINSIGT